MRRLVSPKSPLMVFSELFKDVPIHLQEHPLHNVMSYTATLEIDGQMYSGNHISKTQAKQKACENFLRIMLAKKISERSEKKEETPMDVKMEIGENSSVSKPKGPPQEDFPWPHFASLAMHNLINQWELQPVVTKANYVQEEPNVIKPQPKAGAMRKFPENPKNCNPIQLINQMKPGVKFVETIISSKTPSLFQVNCVIEDVSFTGQGSTKKAAKKECCIAAIKFFWQFDFNAIENN
uniref:DRBM domain-containing protein n=1 Tax=Schizaphis graminum TaxID=13262 RepID=A0A2S2NGM1_SCHGA